MLLFLVLTAAAVSLHPAEIEIDALNGKYRDLDWPLTPFEQGAFTVTLSSPRHQLVVHEHRLVFRPGTTAPFEVEVEVEIEGHGEVIAQISTVAGDHTHRDHVLVPRQRLSARGLVSIERVDDPAGFLVTLVEPSQRTVGLEVETEIATSILSLCSVLSRLPFSLIDCNGLGRALQHFQVPTPAAGSSLLIELHQLDTAEIDALERILRPVAMSADAVG